MAIYAERYLKLYPGDLRLFFKTMEATDDGVLYDYHTKSNAAREKALADSKNKSRKSPR